MIMVKKIYEYLYKLERDKENLYSAPNKVAKEFGISRTMAGAIIAQWEKDKNSTK
tara:strand:+ start:716 stop:880 length:165 start_codon:yes stop_codon:yes gene_type:complete